MRVKWDVTTPALNAGNTGWGIVVSPRYNTVLNTSNTLTRDNLYTASATYAITGTPIFDALGSRVCDVIIGDFSTSTFNAAIRARTAGNHTNVQITDVWDLYRYE